MNLFSYRQGMERVAQRDAREAQMDNLFAERQYRSERDAVEDARAERQWVAQQEQRALQNKIANEQLAMQREEARRAGEAHAATLTAAEQQREIAEMTRFSGAGEYAFDLYQTDPERGMAAWNNALQLLDEETRANFESVSLEQWPEVRGVVHGGLDAFEATEPKADSAAEQEIARLMETGLDRNTAINIADGVWVTSTNPQTGEAQIIDKATGRPVAAEQAQMAPQPEAAPSTVPELSLGDPTTPTQPVASQFGEQFTDSDRAFGLAGFARGAANTATDAFGLGQPFPGVAATQRDFNVISESLTNLFAQSYPRQPAQKFLTQIQDLIPAPGIPWRGPEDAREKLAALGRSFLSERASVERQLGTRKMRPNVRQQLESRLAVLDQALQIVSNAHGSFGADEAPAADPSDIDLMNSLLSDG